jgi:AraC-like DNA-binding protein
MEYSYLQRYLSNLRVELYVVAYAKVGLSWQDHDFTPSFNRFYYILEGEGYLKIEDQIYKPKPGELYLLPAGVRQSYGTVSENTFGKFYCHFGAKLGDLHLLDIVRTSPKITVADASTLQTMFQELIQHAEKPKLTSAFRVNALLLQLISMYLEQAEPVHVDMKATVSLEKMGNILQYIEDHLQDDLTVELLAREAHFHPNYFIALFKKSTGYSPIQYINRLRMEKAKHQLSFSQQPVSMIAEGLGMEFHYFSRTFREFTGSSPSQWRENSNEKSR